MSVSIFSVAELANVAHVMLDCAPTVNHDSYGAAVDTACGLLALVSEANVTCFNDCYARLGERADKCTADKIKAELIRIDRPAGNSVALAWAVNTVTLMHYNCDDEGGDFLLKVSGAHAALVAVLEGVLRAVARKAGL